PYINWCMSELIILMELLFSLSFYIPFLFQELCFIHDLSAFRLSELAHLSGCCAVDEWIKS
ncbi:TPA: hypothetical protein ACPZJN_004323, partial [Yersinia enterocolitica]